MREDKGELLALNQKDLTNEERDNLVNLDLSFCDICGSIEHSTSLYWLDSEEFWEDETAQRLLANNITAVDIWCYKEEKAKDSKSPEK